MKIGNLTLDAIGTTRVRTEYESATIEGLVRNIQLEVAPERIRAFAGDTVRESFDVFVTLTLGNIELKELRRSHPCEVIA